MEISQKINLPVMQTHLSPWTASKTNSLIWPNAQNYVELIPSYIVFNNMLSDLIHQLGINTEITVIYEEKYRKLFR
jgi:hypothetical protein